MTTDIELPPPPSLDDVVVKRKKDILKEGMDDFDQEWLSQRKKELKVLQIKEKPKKLLKRLFSFSRQEQPEQKEIPDEIQDLILQKEEKLKQLKVELGNAKQAKKLTLKVRKQLT